MHSPAQIAALIVLTSFFSEDAAALGAASLSAAAAVDSRLAFAAAFFGIWVGDCGLYALGLPLRWLALRWRWAKRWLLRAETRLESRPTSWNTALIASRFIPGTRLPLYTAAGLTRFPFPRFAALTAAAVLTWVALLFVFTQQLRSATALGSRNPLLAAPFLLIAVSTLLRWLWRNRGASISLWFRRMRKWEFWPAWLFYPPVLLMCIWHAIRFGGFSLPTIANPGQHNGGIIGESKFQLLRELSAAAPESTPACALIDAHELSDRLQQFNAAMARLALDYPVVLKPDVAQRGQGFRKIDDHRQAIAYLSIVSAAVVLQAYVAAEHEVGVFYYRFPASDHGSIFAITEKRFPCVIGDGRQTLRKLIAADPRASLLASTYLARFAAIVDDVLPAGAHLRLVEAGNHCQGCIFADGEHLRTPELESAIDAIAQSVPGFFIGRFDLRYSSPQEFATGRGFHIIELNGAASEATNIYDARNSLWRAYATLFRQWELVYAIGAANRERAYVPAVPFSVLRDWFSFRAVARCYPAAD